MGLAINVQNYFVMNAPHTKSTHLIYVRPMVGMLSTTLGHYPDIFSREWDTLVVIHTSPVHPAPTQFFIDSSIS